MGGEREEDSAANLESRHRFDIKSHRSSGRENRLPSPRAQSALMGRLRTGRSIATLPVVAPLATPTDFVAATTANGVRLTWRGAGAHYRILRRSEESPDYAEIGTSTTPEFLDSTAEFGKKYSYLVQVFTDLGNHREAQSDLSAEQTLTPEDKFPPAAPAGLHATASANSVELSWEANTEPDLALVSRLPFGEWRSVREDRRCE